MIANTAQWHPQLILILVNSNKSPAAIGSSGDILIERKSEPVIAAILDRKQQQTTPLTQLLLNQLFINYETYARGLRNQVLLKPAYQSIPCRSELCAFKFDDT